MRIRACDQKNQGKNVNSTVAPPHDCHALKKESISNKYLGQVWTGADEVYDIRKATEGGDRAAIRTNVRVTRVPLAERC